MSLRKFFGATSREALMEARRAIGDDAVVISTRRTGSGVEVVAASEAELSKLTAGRPGSGGPPRRIVAAPAPAEPADEPEDLPSVIRNPRAPQRPSFAERVRQTEPAAPPAVPPRAPAVPFLDYLRRPTATQPAPVATQPAPAQTAARPTATQSGLRPTATQSGQRPPAAAQPAARAAAPQPPAAERRAVPQPAPPAPAREPLRHAAAHPSVTQPAVPRMPLHAELPAGQPSPLAPAFLRSPPTAPARAPRAPEIDPRDLPDLHDDRELGLPMGSMLPVPDLAALDLADALRDKLTASLREELGSDIKRELQTHLRAELRNEFESIRGWMSAQFDTIAFSERQRRRPVAASMQKMLLADGFSPLLARDLALRLPEQLTDEAQARGWARAVLERNLHVMGNAHDIVDTGGIYALVGPTGVGKTTTVAKLAARCAAKYGRDSVGLVTIDSYRIGAQDQLRIYGKILGVTVHTAQDRESLLGVLRGLTGKKLVLIDTLGLGQRDERVAELLDAVGAGAIKRLLVLNAASHAETLEDVVASYRLAGSSASGKTVAGFAGAVLTKTDEAVRLGQALDVLIRHRLPLYYETTGQRVPEDITPASAGSLVTRALAHAPARPFRVSDDEVGMTYVDRSPDPLGAAPIRPAHA
ncbi:flagellar biosynthesis protein FlhF [Derxia lacustris]|uniref:flagellar biosynthesis protein FlhF n=1 Tax=Derxia lacustris TaxID=764842 RepID=UPI000A174699|nr:flagellar biosynthesis protein FlhF [Derxia lacustris]